MSKSNIEAVYPLSPTQEGLLFHTINEPGSGVYFEQYHCLLRGPLDADAFRSAWEQVTARHAVLRSLFTWERRKQPLQLVRESVELPFAIQDWRGLSPYEQEHRLDDFLAEDRRAGFVIDQAPLMRFTLIRMDPDIHRFVWSFHHLLLDGWSTYNVLQEAFSLYDANTNKRQVRFLDSRPYLEYIRWVQSQDQEVAREFWQQELGDFSEPTEAPLARLPESPLPDATGTSYAQEIQSLPVDLTSALQRFARTNQLTLNTVIQGAWALLLQRYSGKQDVIFGTTVSGRPVDLDGVEKMVGLFINTLPIRVRTASESKLLPWLSELQNQNLEMRQYEYSSLAKVQTWSGIPPGSTLFETLLVFENYPIDAALMPASNQVQMEDAHHVEQSNYPLALIVLPSEKIQLYMIYDTSKYDQTSILQLLQNLSNILQSFTDNPGARLDQIEMLSKGERDKLLVTWNETKTNFPRQKRIHDLIEAYAEQIPNAPAVIFEHESLTYAQLDMRANQLANHLIGLGVQPGDLVVLCVERSLEMIVAILGVLKSGAAYVPLDPAYPPERLSFMLQDTAAPVIITQPHTQAILPESDAHILIIDSNWSQIRNQSSAHPSVNIHPDHLAYVIYTSGSTGKPKGVPVTHRNLVHSTTARFQFYPDPVERFLLLSSFAFDSSVVGIFWTLCQGGTLILPRQKQEQNIYEIAALIHHNNVTHLLSLPTLYQLLLEYGESNNLASLNTVIVAGEACPVDLVRKHYQLLPEATLYNEYGPTEGTVWSSACIIPSDFNDSVVPIGKPIPNMHAYVLDYRNQPMPIGVAGELYIGGEGLANGYLNRPDLTEERFVTNPFKPDERLYRTGDLVRWLADGQLVFLGRIDNQVKIRGHRIELEEIEAALLDQSNIAQAVVLAKEEHMPSLSSTDSQISSPKNTRLLAFVVPQAGCTAETSQLRAALTNRLPDYMLPHQIITLDVLPLTPNGKVDRNALASVNTTITAPTSVYLEPTSETEKLLAQIWTDVLNLDGLSVHDNFFEIGGDSILSIQIVARARAAGLEITPALLFKHPTIAELANAAILDQLEETLADQGIITGPVPLTPIQNWFFANNLQRPAQWNQAVLLRLHQPVPASVIKEALRALLQHHDALRTSFKKQEGEWVQEQVGMPDRLPLDSIDLLQGSTAEQAIQVEQIANRHHQSLRLDQADLFRMVHLRYNDSEEGLLLVIHHLVIDGVSWRLLLEDLHTALDQRMEGRPIALPLKTTAFQVWSQHLQNFSSLPTATEAKNYWLSEHFRKPQPLPYDYEVDDELNTVASGDVIERQLSKEETRALLEDVPGVYHTQINDVLLTALVQAQSEWVQESSVLFALEGHGREHLFENVDVTRTVGWFTNVFPVRLDLKPDEALGQKLLSVKEQLRAVPENGISYGLLKQSAEYREALSAIPEPKILFNYLGRRDAELVGLNRFELETDMLGEMRFPGDRRLYQIEVNCLIRAGRFHSIWSYSRNLHKEITIQRLADHFNQALRALIEHCRSPQAGGHSLSDFPLADLDQESFDQIAGLLNATDH